MPWPTVMGETVLRIASMEFTVEVKNGKCGVVVAKAEWEIRSTRYADEYVFNDKAPPKSLFWNWADYEKAKAQNMSDRDWHDKTAFGSWYATEAHEDAHVAQIKDVAGAALAEYVKKYNAAPEWSFDNPHAAMDQANRMSSSEDYWRRAGAAMMMAVLQKYGAWGPTEAGEEGATQAERAALEIQYQKYLRSQQEPPR
jgi:hypothetical protein